jgi:hypothetical protein
MSTYKPKAGSIPERVCQFFLANPEEELTRQDMALKFEMLPSSCDQIFKLAVEAGLLERKTGDDGVVWSAGTRLTTAALTNEQTPPPSTTDKPKGFKGWLAKKGHQSAEGRTRAIDLPPPSELILLITKDVPLPSPKQRSDDYHPVWAAMNVNDSIAVAPAAAKRLVNWARGWAKPHKRKFVVKAIDADTTRIWRTE